MNLGKKSLFWGQQAMRFGVVLTQNNWFGLFSLTILIKGL